MAHRYYDAVKEFESRVHTLAEKMDGPVIKALTQSELAIVRTAMTAKARELLNDAFNCFTYGEDPEAGPITAFLQICRDLREM